MALGYRASNRGMTGISNHEKKQETKGEEGKEKGKKSEKEREIKLK